MNIVKKCVSAVVCAMVLSSTVLAGNVLPTATISDFSGKVLVNHGKGFVPVTGSEALLAGDKILVGENAFAVVSYADCAVSLSSPTVMSVSAKAPCVGGSADATFVQPVADIDPGYVAPVAPLGLPLPLILLGAVGTVGVIAVASGVLDDDKPVSAEVAPL